VIMGSADDDRIDSLCILSCYLQYIMCVLCICRYAYIVSLHVYTLHGDVRCDNVRTGCRADAELGRGSRGE
jgi:hypothetical protein